MARYIDADKLIDHIKDLPTWREILGIGWRATKYPNGMFDCNDVINSIEDAPTADVAEVKHGEWVDNEIQDSILSKCSVCGFSCGAYTFNYCPNCGAKMDGKEDA